MIKEIGLFVKKIKLYNRLMLLSVIIVSYNQAQVLSTCLKHLQKNLSHNFSQNQFEIIVVDNNSLPPIFSSKESQKGIRLVLLKENTGFSRANNIGLQLAKGQYILFLNSDVYLSSPINFKELIAFLEKQPKRAGLTIRLNLTNGQIDPASHRGFPNPYNALSYFLGFEKLFAFVPGLNRIFGGYHLTYKNLNTVHEIDSPTAAFFLLKKNILDRVNGFDPDYFFYGEDLDLSYRIKNLGYSIWYYPLYSGLHLKYQSGLKSSHNKTKAQSKKHFYKSMLLFYKKHYYQKYPRLLYYFVEMGVKLKSLLDR